MFAGAAIALDILTTTFGLGALIHFTFNDFKKPLVLRNIFGGIPCIYLTVAWLNMGTGVRRSAERASRECSAGRSEQADLPGDDPQTPVGFGSFLGVLANHGECSGKYVFILRSLPEVSARMQHGVLCDIWNNSFSSFISAGFPCPCFLCSCHGVVQNGPLVRQPFLNVLTKLAIALASRVVL